MIELRSTTAWWFHIISQFFPLLFEWGYEKTMKKSTCQKKMQMKIDWLEDKPWPGPHQILVLIIHTILSLAGSRKERRCNIREAKKKS